MDNGGAWVGDPSFEGCDIPLLNAIYADMSVAVMDNVVAPDIPDEVVAVGNVKHGLEHEHFLETLGFFTLLMWALFFIMWVCDYVKAVNSKRRAKAVWEDLARAAGVGIAKEDGNSEGEGEVVDKYCDEGIEKV